MSRRSVFRWALRLLPRHLRDAYGDEIAALFRERLSEALRRSRLTGLRHWWHGMTDLVTTAVRTRSDLRRGSPRLAFPLWVESVRMDGWQAIRALRHRPGFAALVVLTLGLGIGATTTVFSVFDAVLLRSLPFPSPDRLVSIGVHLEGRAGVGAPPPDVVYAWKEAAGQLAGIDFNGAAPAEYTMTGAGGTTSVRRQWVGQALFDVLGAQPVLGRSFRPEELTLERTSETVVLSHEFWRRHFAEDPSVIGRTVVLLGLPRAIIGVMPPGFRVEPTMPDVDVWLAQDFRGSGNTQPATGRLKAGVSVEQASAELQAILDAWQADRPPDRRLQVDVRAFGANRDGYRRSLAVMFGAAGIVLLICCVNTVGLLTMHGVGRGQEVAIRMALGARRRRVARALLIESIVLALLGGLAGVALAAAGIRLFVAIAAGWYPATETFELNTTVLAFAGLVSLAVGAATGLLPAVRAPAVDVVTLVKQGRQAGASPRRRRGAQVLVLTQVALALVLLTGTVLLGNSLLRMLGADMGFDTHGLAVAQIRVQGDRYQVTDGPINHTPAATEAFFERLTSVLAATPGIARAGVMSSLPTGTSWSVPVRAIGAFDTETEPARALYQEVSDELFDTIDLPVVRGRAFSARDTAAAPWVAILSESLARQLFGDANPIGQVVQADLTARVVHPALTGDRPREVVGVVADMRGGLRQGPRRDLYVPIRQHLSAYPRSGPWGVHLLKYVVIREASGFGAVDAALRDAVAVVDDTQQAVNVQSMDDFLARTAGMERLWTRVIGLSALLALLLAALGIYGVVAQTVLTRRHEMGIRLALGADSSGLVRMIVRQSLSPVLGGVFVGAGLAAGLSRFLARLLYDIGPTDVPSFALAAVTLVVVAVLACYLPASRSARIRPVVTLRHD